MVRFAERRRECRLDLDHLRSLLSERTRVVAFPWASNAVGTVTPVAEVAALAHEAGALAWVDAVHYAPHGPIDVSAAGADVLLCSPYKFYGPHLGLAFGRRELLERWRPYKVRPAPTSPVGRRFETGTLAHELLAGFVAAVEYLRDVGWDFVLEHERELGQRFLDGLPDGVDAARRPDDGRACPDVRDHARARGAGRRVAVPRRPRASPCGTGTTTRSRSCSASACRRRDPGRHRPLQHRGRGRRPPRGVGAPRVAARPGLRARW